jgi:hypothetical protein
MPIFARVARLLHVARSRHVGWVVLPCLLVATALVLGTLPGRRTAERTEGDAWVPLRQLTPHEAAFLLRDGAVQLDHAAIVGLTQATVLLASRDYVREAASASGTAPEERSYLAAAANWSGRCTLYELERRALEAELGRPFRVEEIDGTFIERYPVSLQPSLVPLYALVEIAFLTIWATAFVAGLLSGLQRLPGPRVWLAGLASWLVAPCVFVWFYSPAFYDADFFHQRIVLESVAAALLVPVLMGVWLVPALLAWALLAGVTSHLARARARGGPRQRRRLLAAYVGGALALFVVWRVSAWTVMRRRCAGELALIEARIGDGNALATLLEHRSLLPRASGPLTSAAPVPPPIPAAARTAVDQLLASTGPGSMDFEVLVLLPTGDGLDEHLLLRRWGYRYADIRVLDARFALTDVLAEARSSGSVSASPLASLVFVQHVCAKQVPWTRGTATVIVQD